MRSLLLTGAAVAFIAGNLAAQLPPALDYQTYRDRIEPIFLKQRPQGVRCYDCHSVLVTRMRLQPFSPGSSSWSDEQSRRNFAVVSALVTPQDPLKSPLLLHPLAREAGGDPIHTGGKFWSSRSDPEWKMIAAWVAHRSSPAAAPTVANATVAAPPSAAPAAVPAVLAHSMAGATLDFQFYRTNVEPVFLKQRPGHARCYACHTEPRRAFHLEKLLPGSAGWTEAQSRLNFQNVLQHVAPGDPESSRILMHPLAPEAGGDAFHSGGRQFRTPDDPDWLTLAEWVRRVQYPATATGPSTGALIYVTNSAGDTVDVIDPATNSVVQVIRGVETPHGVNFSSDGSRVYISNEAENALDVVDRKSGAILNKIPLSGRPNNLAVTKDGRVLVGIWATPGAVDIVDTVSLKRVRSIPLNSSVHNVYVTPDGKYAASGSIEGQVLTIIDLQSEKVIGEIKFDSGVRPMTFETNADGSTSRIFVQLSGFNGFAVVDFARREEVARIKLPDQPGGFGIAEGRLGTPSHGIGVAPDGKSLWVNSTAANAVFAYSLPGLTLIGHVDLPLVHPLGRTPTGAVPEWITFTPDSRRLYISDSAARAVSVIDVKTLTQIAVVPVGEVPKRNNTLVVH
ncbi:MAG: hypothetical protein GZ088_05370 [Acidipila sp.]|nr:hypothetical protein [Acidipila sp.]